MADLSNVPAIIQTGKTLFEMIMKIGNNEIVNGIATIMGLSGFSLRDFIGKKQLSKMIHKLKCHFKGKEITEKQEEILRESFLELEDYIKNCEELDEKVFENISNIIVKGIDNEDILTREYIKILKKISWLDLKFLILFYGKHIPLINTISKPSIGFIGLGNLAIEQIKDFRKEIVLESLDKLSKLRLVNKAGECREKNELNGECKYYILTELGEDIVNLITAEQN